MPTSIPVVGGPGSTDFVPGAYIAVNFGQGASAGFGSPIAILLMGNKSASAPALTDGYVYGPDVEGFTVSSVNDVVTSFGSGSELHRAYLRIAAVNQSTPVYFLAVAESAGVQATGSITFTTTATGNGFVRTYVGNAFVDTSVLSGDSSSTIATNVAASVNSQATWAVTASPSTSTVTLTAKNKGPRGNYVRYASKVNGSIGTTSNASNFANLAGGTVEDSWTSALATISPKHFRYIVAAAEDATPSGNAGLLVAQVNNQGLAINGNRQRCAFGQNATIGTANTFAKALNSQRAEVVWQPNSNMTPFELAASAVGAYALGESLAVPVLNFDGMGVTTALTGFWSAAAPFDGSAPSRNDIKSALISGVTPVATGSNGSSYVVSRVTSYSQDASGNLDTRTRDGHIPTVMDLGADLLVQMFNTKFGNKLLAADPPPGGSVPGPQVVTPNILLASINKVIKGMGDDGLIQNTAQSIAATQVNLESSPDGRASANIQLRPISLFHQFTANLNQVTSIA